MLSSQSNYQSRGARQHITSALDLVIHMERGATGHRFIRNISEIVGLEGDVITSQELFRYNETDDEQSRAPEDMFSGTGIRPNFQEKIKKFGCVQELMDVMT
ncbi:MAG: hypothetical protein COB93_06930 [Sneathiella sp.]|nr:MAG: hypothetical protein COB93_06930 [Sneathiella sp.]